MFNSENFDYGWFASLPFTDPNQAISIAKLYLIDWEEVDIQSKTSLKGQPVWIILYRKKRI
ncbi:hypothetical protein BHU72_14620 [Desulfuribacillus stibiiarsenatis]|uniref:Uncharacterized protein n=1 Tax=Desulfuribacillus stibiiarsenatis TaxID=1390249 RepID=A0A1E5L7D1_9FIRM|nr:hypothetical protein [Desulfuribacillus stibiiarsenatis]OEH86060.1 hypothetical protein BHU72_14620 [Desulfuribacillus stibiiarsenatis]